MLEPFANQPILELRRSAVRAELAQACKDRNGKLCMVSAVAFGMTGEESEAALAPLEQGAMVKKALPTQVMCRPVAGMPKKAPRCTPENLILAAARCSVVMRSS